MKAFHLKDFQVLYRLLNIEIILLTGEIQPVKEQCVGNCWKTYTEHVGQCSKGSKHTGFKQILPNFRGRSRQQWLLHGALSSYLLANTCWSEILSSRLGSS